MISEIQNSYSEKWMNHALDLAKQAFEIDEVPVGAVLVKNDAAVSIGYNKRETTRCVLKHAEIIAIEEANKRLQSWRLDDCDLFVTLEPCLMCAGAIYQARLKNVYFGAYDPKGGAFGSLYAIHEDNRLNHKVNVHGNVLGDKSIELLQTFFKARREQ